jgi:hypothetical protein
MPISNADLLKIIQHFVPGDPLSYKLRDDGSLVVIADSGKKFTFSADQVSVVHNFLKQKPKTPPTSQEVVSTPSKTATKPKSMA